MKNSALLTKLLKSVPLFQELTTDELTGFLSHCRQQELPAGCTVVSQGEHGRHLYVVLSGQVEVLRRVDEREVVKLATLWAGEVFGELALVDFGERSASVTATEMSRVLSFDRMDVVKLAPSLLAKLYRNVGAMMASRLRETNSIVSVLLAEKAAEEDAQLVGSGFTAPSQRKVLRR